MSNTAIHRARSSALPGQPGPLGQAVQPHLSARGRPCEQPPGGPHSWDLQGRCLWTGRVGGWRAGRWECGGLFPAREPRPAGEKRVGSSRPTWTWRPAGEGGGAWGCGGGAGRRAESLTCPDRGWLEVAPGPGRGRDRMEKHSCLPILPAATPTLSAHHYLLP